jgi:hypothetical protein
LNVNCSAGVLPSQLLDTRFQSLLKMEEPDIHQIKKRGTPAAKDVANNLSSSMSSHPLSTANVANMERWAITRDLVKLDEVSLTIFLK